MKVFVLLRKGINRATFGLLVGVYFSQADAEQGMKDDAQEHGYTDMDFAVVPMKVKGKGMALIESTRLLDAGGNQVVTITPSDHNHILTFDFLENTKVEVKYGRETSHGNIQVLTAQYCPPVSDN